MQNLSPTSQPTSPPLRAAPRHPSNQAAPGHIKGIEATSGGLIRATLGAAVAAGLILALFWLPAEYGIDPTGAGRAMGLTEMGEIKQQLYAENAADTAVAKVAPAPTTPNDPLTGQRLDRIETQLATIIIALNSLQVSAQAAPAPVAEPAAEPAAPVWRDEVSYTLVPGEGVEVKLVMQQDAVAEFDWHANGAVLNFDTHGDGGGLRISYEKGRGVDGQQGSLVAAFTGNHGWFWRNRTDGPVTVTLRTRGEYASMKAP